MPLLTTVLDRCSNLFSVRNPDVLHLNGVLEEEMAFALFGGEPIESTAFVGPNLFQVADGQRFRLRAGGFITEAPDGVNVIVFSQRLEQIGRSAGNNIEYAHWKNDGC